MIAVIYLHRFVFTELPGLADKYGKEDPAVGLIYNQVRLSLPVPPLCIPALHPPCSCDLY